MARTDFAKFISQTAAEFCPRAETVMSDRGHRRILVKMYIGEDQVERTFNSRKRGVRSQKDAITWVRSACQRLG